MADFTVEPLSVDMEAKYMAFLREYDFSPGDESTFRWYRNLKGTTMYVSTDNGKIIASGMSISMGKTGWIGAICAHEDYRGMGLGKAMTERCTEMLREQGADSILLRASEEGARLYRKMGFKDTYSYDNFFAEEGDFKFTGEPSFKAIGTLSERHISMDSEFTGEFRGQILRSLGGISGYELAHYGELEGFVYPSATNGIVGMARDPDFIPDLVSRIMSGNSGKLRSIKGSAFHTYMREMGFEKKDGARRMCLGEDPLKNKNGIIGTISSSIG